MKKSEKLKLASEQEDGDNKSFALLCKELRENRSEKFQEYLHVLELRYNVEIRNNGSYSINTQDFGIIDYFPKANKLLIRKDNKWIKPGLKWIVSNLLN